MKKRLSLQWKLTLLTALLVMAACLSLSLLISRSAVLYMNEIEDSVITILPKQALTQGAGGGADFSLDITDDLSGQIRNTQAEFWTGSLLATLLIALTGSAMTYFVVGYALRPLRQLSYEVGEIQAKNMQQPVQTKGNAEEIDRLTEAFNGMLQRLGEAFFVQRQFSANAAHELRTPLAVMQAKLEVLGKQQDPSAQDYAEAVDMVRVQTERLSRVIDMLLEMTELHTAQRSDSISLAALVEEVLCDLAPLAAQKRITLSQGDGEAQLLGSDTLIYRAVYNLVENAIKYNHIGGEAAVEIESENGYASILVTDSGQGIDKADRERIFEPFFRVDKSRSRAMGGAGLGLALVREVAQLHGGTVRVRQSTAQGTQIELRLWVGAPETIEAITR